jgi:hypothetical protein
MWQRERCRQENHTAIAVEVTDGGEIDSIGEDDGCHIKEGTEQKFQSHKQNRDEPSVINE